MDEIRSGIGEWLAAWDPDSAWFTIFWLLLIVFALVELLVPAVHDAPRRRDRWPANLGMALINITIMLLPPVSTVVAAQWAQARGIGLMNLVELPWWAVATATWLIRSLALYLFHWATHKVPLFWRFHRVHHCDRYLDVSTTVRAHPVEFAVQFVCMIAVAVGFGLDPAALMAYQIFESASLLFNHSNIRLPERWDRPLRWLIVTPNMHSLHHSVYQPETDSNYGSSLSIWDRLFGTYSAAPKDGWEGLEIGLNEIDFDHANDIVWQIRLPALGLDPTPTEVEANPPN